MKIAFSVALMASLALGYSGFKNGFLCCGAKETASTTATVASAETKSCSAGCCAKEGSALSLVSVQSEAKSGACSECPNSDSQASTCCTKDSTKTVAHKSGECSETCSLEKECGQDKAGTCCSKDKTQVVAHQKSECTGACAEGGKCCQDKGATSECSKDQENATLVSDKNHGGCSETCSKEGSSCESKSCCLEAMAKLPKMTFLVGSESVCCPDAAAALAEKNSETIKYVVASKEFDSKDDAFVALVEETEAFVKAFTTPAKCEASGKTSLCGTSTGCCETAAKQADAVSKAIKGIMVSYQVDGKEAACVNCAKAASEKTGKPIEYVVAGETTQCELNARLMAAKAKYEAAIKAIAEISTEVTDQETSKPELTSTNG